jgi:hypothetical protein
MPSSLLMVLFFIIVYRSFEVPFTRVFRIWISPSSCQMVSQSATKIYARTLFSVLGKFPMTSKTACVMLVKIKDAMIIIRRTGRDCFRKILFSTCTNDLFGIELTAIRSETAAKMMAIQNLSKPIAPPLMALHLSESSVLVQPIVTQKSRKKPEANILYGTR